MNTTFEDKQLNCSDCGNPFVFTAGEQQFYADKGFTNAPLRCKDCRAQRKNSRRDERGSGQREEYEITCSNCGKQGTVPFKPTDPSKAVYCNECFKMKTASRTA